MKNKFLLVALLSCVALFASAQTISVPYPCNVITEHDSTYTFKKQITYPVYSIECKKFLWYRYDCKQVLAGWKDSLQTLTVKEPFEHDTTVTCYRDSIIPAPIASTMFGAKITQGSFEEQHNALKSLGVKLVRPNSITLKTWVAGSKTRVDEFLEADNTCILNVCWDESTPGTIIPFCKDLKSYREKFTALAKQYSAWAKKGKLILAIENEEFNRGYFSGPITDYLNLLDIAVEICAQYEIPVSDGGLALEFVNMLRTGDYAKTHASQVAKFDTLINHFTKYTYKGFSINTHIKASGSSFTSTIIEDNCFYLRNRTGKVVFSNEWHLVNATTQLMNDVIGHWIAARVPYSIIFDEKKDQNGNITNGAGIITPLGEDFRDAILYIKF